MFVSPVRLRQLLRRRRRVFAAALAALAVGVLTHHAMPEQAMADTGHGMGQHATAAMVMCLSVAAAVGLWAVNRPPRLHPLTRPDFTRARRSRPARFFPTVLPRARAGPLGPVVLRI